jgi:hypothetical protein
MDDEVWNSGILYHAVRLERKIVHRQVGALPEPCYGML